MHPYEKLFLEGFKHQIRVLQNRSALQKEVIRLVHAIEIEWKDRLIAAGSNLSGQDIRRIKNGQYSGSVRLKKFASTIDEFMKDLSSRVQALMTERLRDVAAYEGMFWGDRFKKFIDEVPALDVDLNRNTTRKAKSNVTRNAVVALTLAQAYRQYRKNRTERIRQKVTTAAQNDGLSGLISFFRVSRRNRTRGRIFGETTKTIGQGVQNMHNHAISSGVKALTEQNEFMDSVWTAMLDNGTPGIDGKTSQICISRNGKFINRDLGGQVPPGHQGPCRSQIFPAIDYKLLSRKQKKALDKDTRTALQNGLPDLESSTKAFNDNLTPAEQLEQLGPTRFKLFKEGKLSFPKDFIDPKEERRYTLEEIARREGFDDISELLAS